VGELNVTLALLTLAIELGATASAKRSAATAMVKSRILIFSPLMCENLSRLTTQGGIKRTPSWAGSTT
jgi:hypothetical protein